MRMKNKLTVLGSVFLGAVLLGGCGSDKKAGDELIIEKDNDRIVIDTPAVSAVSDLAGLQLSCRVFYDDNSSDDASGFVSWSSSDTAVATVSSGLVSMSSSEGGDVNITAGYGPFSDTITLNVYALNDINVTINDSNVITASTYQMTATGTFTDTKTDINTTEDITNEVSWLSFDTSIATVDSAGVLTTQDTNGSVEIMALTLDINGSIDLNVTLH